MTGVPLSVLRSAPRRMLVSVVRAYRLLFSPWLGSACRFEPTCSAYALQALERHGAGSGSLLTLARLARCHPFCQGGHDPVPVDMPRLFSRLLRHDQNVVAHPSPAEKTSP